MGWGLLQNCSKGEAGGTDAIFSVTSDKVTMELEKHVTAFTSFCTEGKKKIKPQQNGNVPSQRSR